MLTWIWRMIHQHIMSWGETSMMTHLSENRFRVVFLCVSLLVLVLCNLVFEWTRLLPAIKTSLLLEKGNISSMSSSSSDGNDLEESLFLRAADHVNANLSDGQQHTSRNSSINRWVPSDAWIENCVRLQKETNTKVVYSHDKVQWLRYMLGDCILKDCGICAKSKRVSEYKDLSIAGEYWHHICHQNRTTKKAAKGNLTFVDELFDRYERNPYPYKDSWPIPEDDELVIHLRIGDVMDEPYYLGSKNASVIEMLRDGHDTRHGPSSYYRKGIKSISQYLSIIRASGFTKLVLKGGSHNPKVYPNSRIYSHCLADAIRTAGYTVTSFRVSGEDNPDRDFYYMSHAKHFVRATGGYSGLIASMVKRRGGMVWDSSRRDV